ncbi:PfkB family carbohydrate kinase [Candidatus Pelagibacter bacterium nBUS_30]|uniref:PfkB family carbohydrate kinase n=1 Tax=Candidatus Pelagibacter bacterium nBUS_30 TaxID=3374191 RepID=UPI003EC11E30
MKILKEEKIIIKKINDLIKSKKKIVMCHGVFDILHLGHIKHFEEAKSLGDILIISVTSNKYVNKGFERPYFDLKTRMETLSSLSCVDYVIASDFPTAEKNLTLLKPNFYVKGPDYKHKPDITHNLIKEKKIIKKFNGKIYFTKGQQFSSSAIVNSFSTTFDEKQKFFLDRLKKKYSLEEIQSYISKIKKIEPNIFGEIILDTYQFCEPIGISGKDPFLVFKNNLEKNFAGGSFAIAKNSTNFTKKTNLISIFSNQKKYKSFFKSKLSKNFILDCVIDSDFKDIIKKRYLDINTNSKIFGVYEINEKKISKNSENKVIKLLKKYKKKSNKFIISDYGHGLVTDKIAQFISKNKFVYCLNAQINSANRGYHGLFKFKNPDTIIINLSELRYEFKDRFTKTENLMVTLKKKLNAKTVVVTRGSKGAIVLSSSNNFIKCPAFAKNTTDKVGAGDALLTIFSLCRFVGMSDDLAIFISSISAANQTRILNNEIFLNRDELLKTIMHILK